MFTLGNLICGFFAIVVAARVERPTSLDPPQAVDIAFQHPTRVMKQLDPTDDTHNIMLSGWLIFLAMVFDALDGYVARLARTTSDFGAQLDSLCDVVSFGVAPGFLLVKMCPTFTYSHDKMWVIAAAFAACAALRLARFNVEIGDDDDHLHFSGLPSPAAAASIAGFAIMFYELRRAGQHAALRRRDRQMGADRPAVFRLAGGAVDGVADSLSARGQPGAARAAQLRPRRGAGVRLRGDHVDPRLFGADHRLRVRAGGPAASTLCQRVF